MRQQNRFGAAQPHSRGSRNVRQPVNIRNSLLGGVRVSNGEVESAFEDTGEGRLLAYLAYHHLLGQSNMPSRKKTAGDLWPGISTAAASTRLDSQLYNLRKKLESQGFPELVASQFGIFEVRNCLDTTDLQEFLHKAGRARQTRKTNAKDSIRLYEEVVRSYRPVLDGFDLDKDGMGIWKERQAFLRDTYRRIRFELAETLLQVGNATEALAQAEAVFLMHRSEGLQDEDMIKVGNVIIRSHAYNGDFAGLANFRGNLADMTVHGELASDTQSEKSGWPDKLLQEVDKKLFDWDAASPESIINYTASRKSSGLIGRPEILSDIRARLLQPDSDPLIALYGLPGVGKTALADALVNDSEVRGCFDKKVLRVGLGRFPDIVLTLRGWVAALGISEAQAGSLKTARELADRLHVEIGDRRMLIFLDDVWDAGVAQKLKVGGPNCTYLLTTRMTDLPDALNSYAVHVPALTEEEGLALLRSLAWKAADEGEAAARSLVRSVGGLPLALTLMGNYLRVESHSG